MALCVFLLQAGVLSKILNRSSCFQHRGYRRLMLRMCFKGILVSLNVTVLSFGTLFQTLTLAADFLGFFLHARSTVASDINL